MRRRSLAVCDHAFCDRPPTVKTRFGDGTFSIGAENAVRRMTFVRYCDQHFQEVDRLFVLCDVVLLEAEDGPNGLSRLAA